MREVWLHSNRRIAAAGIIVGMLLAATGAMLAVVAVAAEQGTSDALGLQVAGGTALGLGTALLIPSAYSWWRPRLAFDGQHLLAYLKWGAPYRVPIQMVECFFIGQTESHLPAHLLPAAESSSVVIRLAQSASQWHRQPVAPRLGDWFGGYIIIRGTWSAPLTKEVVEQLNQRLVGAHRLLATTSPDRSQNSEQASGT